MHRFGFSGGGLFHINASEVISLDRKASLGFRIQGELRDRLRSHAWPRPCAWLLPHCLLWKTNIKTKYLLCYLLKLPGYWYKFRRVGPENSFKLSLESQEENHEGCVRAANFVEKLRTWHCSPEQGWDCAEALVHPAAYAAFPESPAAFLWCYLSTSSEERRLAWECFSCESAFFLALLVCWHT